MLLFLQTLRSINYVQLTDCTMENKFFLEQRDPSFMAEYYSTPGTSADVDIPKYYGNWDEDFWVVAPTPRSNLYAITLAYNKEPSSITDTTQHQLDFSVKWNLFIK